MSEIIADHLKDREEISIYDPTSGSGSLLINIGHSVAKHLKSADNIKYYAQELIENTFNLTRMNLVMRGILPSNIFTRNADTLKTTGRWKASRFIWMPWCPIRLIPSRGIQKTKKTTYVTNALASPRKQEPILPFIARPVPLKTQRYYDHRLAARRAFRGGEEEKIRKNLIEYNHIDAIIGLPANIFLVRAFPPSSSFYAKSANVTTCWWLTPPSISSK